jgi:hypothetical protein
MPNERAGSRPASISAMPSNEAPDKEPIVDAAAEKGSGAGEGAVDHSFERRLPIYYAPRSRALAAVSKEQVRSRFSVHGSRKNVDEIPIGVTQQ